MEKTEKPKTPLEQQVELLKTVAEALPFEAEPAQYESAQEESAP